MIQVRREPLTLMKNFSAETIGNQPAYSVGSQPLKKKQNRQLFLLSYKGPAAVTSALQTCKHMVHHSMVVVEESGNKLIK